MANVSMVDGHIDEPKKQTNYDRIRNMSVEKMVDLIDTITSVCTDHFEKGCHGCPIFETTGHGFCDSLIMKDWLESEVDTE